MPTRDLIRGYVQAGGGSTRFGRDKALAEIAGKPMLLRMCELLPSVTSEVRIVAASGKYTSFGFETVADRWPGNGPLGGVVTALLETASNSPQCEWNLLIGCDMPFLTGDWLQFLADRAARSAAQAVVPKSEHGLEPLCACWRTDVAKILHTAFEDGTRRVTDGLRLLNVEVLDVQDWQPFDCNGRLFWNMNTPADYEQARRILEAK
jgi:molybdopterin-guanine dinucleotide biosynthesis protein A